MASDKGGRGGHRAVERDQAGPPPERQVQRRDVAGPDKDLWVSSHGGVVETVHDPLAPVAAAGADDPPHARIGKGAGKV
jgi:hypothetical protein